MTQNLQKLAIENVQPHCDHSAELVRSHGNELHVRDCSAVSLCLEC